MGGARGGGGRPGGSPGGEGGDGGAAGWLRISLSTTARSSGIELADSPPGASGGSSGAGGLGGVGRVGGGAEGGRVSEERQQPVQLQPSRPMAWQVKDTLSPPHVCALPHRRVHGSSCSWPAAAGRLHNSRPRTRAATGTEGRWSALLPTRVESALAAACVAIAAAVGNGFVGPGSSGPVVVVTRSGTAAPTPFVSFTPQPNCGACSLPRRGHCTRPPEPRAAVVVCRSEGLTGTVA